MSTRSSLGKPQPVERARGATIIDQVGNTPLLPIRNMGRGRPGVRIFAKAEWFNPGGSVKDRPVLWMLREGERAGELKPGKVILDATSGNAGIAYAMLGAALGYRVLLTVPGNASPERKKMLRVYGAEVVFTDPLEGSDGAVLKAREIYNQRPSLYFYPDQYSNAANVRAHYEGTGFEILSQTGGRITHFVAGVGTGGTLMGVGMRLKRYDESVKVVEVQPDSPLHGLEGLKHMESSIKPQIYDPDFADERIFVSTEEAQMMVKRLAREEGLLVGTSSGAAMAAALQISERLKRGTIVTIFPDGGERYLSERYWGEE